MIFNSSFHSGELRTCGAVAPVWLSEHEQSSVGRDGDGTGQHPDTGAAAGFTPCLMGRAHEAAPLTGRQEVEQDLSGQATRRNLAVMECTAASPPPGKVGELVRIGQREHR